MAKQPDDIVLRILKDIQSTLSAHSKRFDRVDERLEGIDNQLGKLRDGMIATFGLASHRN
jgi:archaellum component FlaC